MKSKMIMKLEFPEKKFWSKKTKERRNVDYMLLANSSESEETKYASSIHSELETRYMENMNDRIQEIAIIQRNGKKHLEIVLKSRDKVLEYKENFLLYVSCPNILGDGEIQRDSFLIYSCPDLLNEGVHVCFLPSDQKENNASSLFWMCKEFF